MAITITGTNANGAPTGITGLGNPVHAELDFLGDPIVDPKTGGPLWFPDTLPHNGGVFDLVESSSAFVAYVNDTVMTHLVYTGGNIDPTADMLSLVAVAFFKQGAQDL